MARPVERAPAREMKAAQLRSDGVAQLFACMAVDPSSKTSDGRRALLRSQRAKRISPTGGAGNHLGIRRKPPAFLSAQLDSSGHQPPGRRAFLWTAFGSRLFRNGDEWLRIRRRTFVVRIPVHALGRSFDCGRRSSLSAVRRASDAWRSSRGFACFESRVSLGSMRISRG